MQKDKGMILFGCPPSSDRYCGAAGVTSSSKADNFLPVSSLRRLLGGQGCATVLFCLPFFVVGQADVRTDSAFNAGVRQHTVVTDAGLVTPYKLLYWSTRERRMRQSDLVTRGRRRVAQAMPSAY